MIQRRQRLIRQVFASRFPEGMSDVRLLEIGCGGAQWLTEFMTFGVQARNMAGIELDARRAEDAKNRVMGADIREGDAAELPWEDASFDVVFQSTVFTSILDERTKASVAREAKRVCRPGGFILWYDFAFDSPSNPNVKGVKLAEIKRLFAPWRVSPRRVTLAPPIARRLVPLCWAAAELVETLTPFARTHLLAVIEP